MDVNLAISLVLALIQEAGKIGDEISAAQAAGQTTLSPEAWARITADDDSAAARLAAAIAAAKGVPAPSAPSPAPAAEPASAAPAAVDEAPPAG